MARAISTFNLFKNRKHAKIRVWEMTLGMPFEEESTRWLALGGMKRPAQEQFIECRCESRACWLSASPASPPATLGACRASSSSGQRRESSREHPRQAAARRLCATRTRPAAARHRQRQNLYRRHAIARQHASLIQRKPSPLEPPTGPLRIARELRKRTDSRHRAHRIRTWWQATARSLI